MQCRNCGTEIADKAIVCYRCGTATTDPVRKAVALKPSRSPLPAFVIAAVLLLAALYTGYASQTAADPDKWRTVAGVLTGAAAMVIVLALVRRRRRS
jgi:MYXO-CTERM domain-containing protein